jgi:hypothetical protein
MANVLNNEKKQQILALGQLGWSLRRIQQATRVRRETISAYLKAAGVKVWPPGGWGQQTGSKPAMGVTSDFGAELSAPRSENPGRNPSASACEPFQEAIDLGLSRGRNAMAIWQLLRERHSCQNAEFSPMPSGGRKSRRFVLQASIAAAVQRVLFSSTSPMSRNPHGWEQRTFLSCSLRA